ncbi:hypothetical protein, partial [Streptomyces europaeiscabiei]|uniref:hypothetical protein n=1 Tax=Streptomyces europaeiscabiei TaxID=146819 RepID=UPI001ABFF120
AGLPLTVSVDHESAGSAAQYAEYRLHQPMPSDLDPAQDLPRYDAYPPSRHIPRRDEDPGSDASAGR